jgi:hypothetical protein
MAPALSLAHMPKELITARYCLKDIVVKVAQVRHRAFERQYSHSHIQFGMAYEPPETLYKAGTEETKDSEIKVEGSPLIEPGFMPVSKAHLVQVRPNEEMPIAPYQVISLLHLALQRFKLFTSPRYKHLRAPSTKPEPPILPIAQQAS